MMEENNEKGHLELRGYDAAYKFAKGIFERYPKVMKTIVLFGSYSKGKETEDSDVDIMVVMDDVLNKLDETVQSLIFSDVDKLVKESQVKLHINFVTLTAFWRGVIAADPVSVNVLKYGVPLIDTGYFEPLQALLNMGEIKPTEESIYASLTRSELYMNSAKLKLASVVTDMYWAVVNSAQAAIMRQGDIPPSPEVIPEMLLKLEERGLVNKKQIDDFNEIFTLGKRLFHGEKIDINGEKAQEILIKGIEFDSKMTDIAKSK
ncbi:MAG: nucleotidyltransferase domain-containing protein [Candidatus Parvarchaeota archaeon]|nr:nucleotidyltransferase domain-containing protein [Candidatus Parvarchaeota archaeon]MCW1294446.1 nucleotidyltransferase domain-containing protein [Candidatus Parvarchaeum tengchongense]MCW1295151.1 nucleotidyltransferase domain-containing protein [Candidatus Parvarchaeum tengchongense]MCW1299020.1 nucleotidyltransferase domain-containing protein [Candidatus Parvarchaeum tengchongense]MCW1312112.1 nucleotidyltransferase domain-containing protein [Candidatus Parvarchaeum tengchongense]